MTTDAALPADAAWTLVVAKAVRKFGGRADLWLDAPCAELGGRTPVAVMETAEGRRHVDAALDRPLSLDGAATPAPLSVVRLMGRLQNLFADRADEWLSRPAARLDGRAPIELIAAVASRGAVDGLLNRLDEARREFQVGFRRPPPPPPPEAANTIQSVHALAMDRFGADADLWFDLPNASLDLAAPGSLLMSPQGRRAIVALLASLPSRIGDAAPVLAEPSSEIERMALRADAETQLGAAAEPWLQRPRSFLGGVASAMAMATKAGLQLVGRFLDETTRAASRRRAPEPDPTIPQDLAGLAADVLGDQAQSWFTQPQPKLHNARPASLLRDPTGQSWVRQALEEMRATGAIQQRETARLAVISLATDLFGDGAAGWLEEPRPMFGGQTARSMLGDPRGRAQVLELLIELAERGPAGPSGAPTARMILQKVDGLFGQLADIWLDEIRSDFYGESASFMMVTPDGRRQVWEMLERIEARSLAAQAAKAAAAEAAAIAASPAPAPAAAPTPEKPPAPTAKPALPPVVKVAPPQTAALSPLRQAALAAAKRDSFQPQPARRRPIAGLPPKEGGPEIRPSEAPPSVPSSSKIFALADELFDKRADAWLETPRDKFGGRSATQMINTAEGRTRVYAELEAIKAGRAASAAAGATRSASETDRLMEAAREILGARAAAWMSQPNPALGGKIPATLIQTIDGRARVIGALKALARR